MIGKTYSEVFVLEDKSIPLPEGEWKVVGVGAAMEKFSEINLIKETNERRLAGAIIIRSDTSLNDFVGYWENKYVNRPDLHFKCVIRNSVQEGLDLWVINHYLMNWTPKRKAAKEFYQYLLDNKIERPKLMIQSYHEITGKTLKNKYLRVEYYYNPEIEGFVIPLRFQDGTNPRPVGQLPG